MPTVIKLSSSTTDPVRAQVVHLRQELSAVGQQLELLVYPLLEAVETTLETYGESVSDDDYQYLQGRLELLRRIVREAR